MSLDESTRNAYLSALGIKQWRTRDSQDDIVEEVMQPESSVKRGANVVEEKQTEPDSVIQPVVKIDVDRISRMDLSTLELNVRGCDACDLHKTRKQTVLVLGITKQIG